MASSIPAWRQAAIDLFADPSVSASDLPAILARARDLNPPPHRLWESVVFDWMEAVAPGQPMADSAKAVDTLQALLDAGLDPAGGGVDFDGLPPASASPRARETLQRAVYSEPLQSVPSRRLAMGLPFRIGHARDQRTTWLSRVVWAARAHPRLPEIVECMTGAGAQVNPGLDGPSSPWVAALAAGRVDALRALHAACPEPPEDWAGTVLLALRRGTSRHGEWAGITSALAWFLHAFPPSADQANKVLVRLVAAAAEWDKPRPSHGLSGHALLAWLSLPGMGLAHAERVGLPGGFNPWLALGNPPSDLAAQHDQLLRALLEHPRFAPQAPDAPPLPWRKWLSASAFDPASQQAHHRLFQDLPDPTGPLAPGLVRDLALREYAPMGPASQWLQAHARWWLPPASPDTPWHHGPRSAMVRWLLDGAPRLPALAPGAPNVQGEPGAWVGMVAALRRGDTGTAASLAQCAVVHGLDWDAPVAGRTARQWAQACHATAQLLPEADRKANVPCLEAALELGHASSIARLAPELAYGGPPLTAQQAQGLVQAWLVTRSDDPGQRAAFAHALRPLVSHLDLHPSARAGHWLARASRREWGSLSLPRPDLAWLLDRYDPGQSWAVADLRALVRWSTSQVSGHAGRPEALRDVPGLWNSRAWEGVDPSVRLRLACVMLRGLLKPSASSLLLQNEVLAGFFGLFPDPLVLGPAGGSRVSPGLWSRFQDRVEPLRRAAPQASVAIDRWQAYLASRAMDQALPVSSPPAPRPTPRL